MKRNKYLFRYVVVLIAGLVVCVGCRKNQPPRTAQPLPSVVPTSTATKTTTVFSTAGVKNTEIYSDSVANFAEQDSTQAYGLRVNFYDSAGDWLSVLTADSGVIREKTEHLEVFGVVEIITRDSVHLLTSQLAWEPATQQIVSDSFVTATRDKDILRGYGMVSDPELKNIVFKRQISGQMEIHEDSL